MMMGLGILLFTVALFLAVMGLLSHNQKPELGLKSAALQACPDQPNCVCSEEGGTELHTIDPLAVAADPDAGWTRLERLITDSGGTIIHHDGDYMHAEFTSLIFRFVDDLEARLDRESGQIHLRSASRVGHSDLGANRKRVEALRMKFKAAD